MAEGNDKPAVDVAHTEAADPTHSQPQQQSQPPPQNFITYLTSLIDASGQSTALNALTALSDSSGHFIPAASDATAVTATPEESLLFLRAVASHEDALKSLVERFCRQLLVSGGAQAPGGHGSVVGAVGDEDDAGACLSRLTSIVQAVGFAVGLVARRSDISRSGIIPTMAKLALAPSPQTVPSSPQPFFALTTAHPEMLQSCLLAGQYRFAERFVDDHPVGSIALLPLPQPALAALASSSTSAESATQKSPSGGGRVVFPGVTSETYLRYHYCLGLVKIGCDDLVAAATAFESCLTTPARGAISAMQVAARKKLLLCCCLLDCGISSMEADDSKTEGANSGGGGKLAGTQDPFMTGGGSGQNPKRSARVRKILSVPAATSPDLSRYLTAAVSSASTSLPSKSSVGWGQSTDPAPGGGEPESEVQESTASSSRRGGGNRSAACIEHERNYYHLNAYDDLVVAFCSNDGGRQFREVKRAVAVADLLEVDGNTGLVDRMQAALQTAAVHQTVRVYDAASLANVAKEMGLQSRPEGQKEAERLIVSMMPAFRPHCTVRDTGTKSLEARIDQDTGTVRFGPFDADGSDDAGASWLMEDEESVVGLDNISAQMGACTALTKRVAGLDLGVTMSNKFQQIAVRGESQSATAGTTPGNRGAKSSGGQGADSGPKSVAELAG